MRARSRLIAWSLIAVLGAACAGPGATGTPTGEPSPSQASPSASPSPVITPSPSPVVTPSPSPAPTAAPTPSPTPTPTAAPTPSPTTGETMVVRAYFFLDDLAGGDPALVPVLRTVPRSVATARAAMTQLLAGPSAKERGADPAIRTVIPAGTELLGIAVDDGVARVDLSAEFATGGGTFSARGRIAQVVYTLTQFSTIDHVTFMLDGEVVTKIPPEGIVLDEPVGRTDFRTDILPAIFVDRPAWGAALVPPGRVTGIANVFEAQFRIALVAANGRILVDRPVLATCGTGCWGRFDVTLDYVVTKAQWGTLRVWDPSERDGRPELVREYPVWLLPADA